MILFPQTSRRRDSKPRNAARTRSNVTSVLFGQVLQKCVVEEPLSASVAAIGAKTQDFVI